MALWITSYYYYHPSLCAHLFLKSNLVIHWTYMSLIFLLGCPWFCCVFCFECHSFYEASLSDPSLAVITFSSGSHRRILFCLLYGTVHTFQLFVYMPLSLTRPEPHCAGLSGRPLCLPLCLVQFSSHSAHLISVGWVSEQQNFRFKCLLVGLDFFFLCFPYSFSISFSFKLAVLSLALTHRNCLPHSLFLPRFCLILSPLAVTVWECHMLLVRFSPSFCGWLCSLQEAYDQRGCIKILTKRPCVKNSP